MINKIIQGNCLEVMKDIELGSVDAIICDPPYGTTQCRWDSIIDFDLMWEQLHRIIKPNGAIVLFGSEPFSSALRMSNIKNYKYDWYWQKSQAVGHLNAWKQPMRNSEIISVFYKEQPRYNPILEDKLSKNIRPQTKRTKVSDCYGKHKLDIHKCPPDKSMPKTIIKFNNAQNTKHPTQKPVALIEYLIKTYTKENELVLDFTIGSGTTAVACINTNRNFIGIEQEQKYVDIARERIKEAMEKTIG